MQATCYRGDGCLRLRLAERDDLDALTAERRKGWQSTNDRVIHHHMHLESLHAPSMRQRTPKVHPSHADRRRVPVGP